MSSDDHKRGGKKKGFCTQPSETKCDDCPCPKNYIEICKPGWAGHTFERLVQASSGEFVFDKKYEAHHIVCVAPVTEHLLGGKLKTVIIETKWCINNKTNMMAMPLWGHTVKWYCSFVTSAAGKVTGAIRSRRGAPPFQDIPQHDFDHNCKEGYTWEVENAVKQLVKDIKDSGHTLKGDDLVEELNDLADDFREKLLDERGVRKGGTHDGWKLGQKGDDEWCHPFSMASDDKVSKIGFPIKEFDSKVGRWIDRIAKAIAAA
jgi:hypothetical protein